jgi:sulfur carrier protein ThiS
MTVQVKWFPTLIKRTKSKQAQTAVDWREGLRPLDVFIAEGFSETDAEAVMVVVNDEQVHAVDLLQDGDRLEFMVSIQGG